MGDPKRVLNCKKANKIGVSRAMAGNPWPGKTRESSPETLINRGLKNPKHGKHASRVGDGSNTVRDIEVHHTAILKSWKR